MSTNKENNLVIIIKDENLLRNSFVTQEHDLISNMIDRRPRVRFGELTTKQVRYFDNIYNKVLRIAIMEWVWIKSFDDYKENEKFHCQLCGQPIKYILKIFNRKTKKNVDRF